MCEASVKPSAIHCVTPLRFVSYGCNKETHTQTDRTMTNFAASLKEMMQNWNQIVAAVRAEFPNATDDEVFEIAKSAMNRSLGIN